jgi:hypothetical protein
MQYVTDGLQREEKCALIQVERISNRFGQQCRPRQSAEDMGGMASEQSRPRSGRQYASHKNPTCCGEANVFRVVNFNVTIPESAASVCTEGGKCAIQWFWYAINNQQTYESCVDFIVG